MKTHESMNLCRQQRQAKTGWMQALRDRLFLRLEDHVMNCPRCQGRLVKVQRVETAIRTLLTQPLAPNLLQKANQRALNMLRRDVRETEPAEKLRKAEVRTDWTMRHRKLLDSVFNTAACLAVLVMLKTGIFSSMKDFKSDSQSIVQNYYAKHLDTDTMQELFRPPPDQT